MSHLHGIPASDLERWWGDVARLIEGACKRTNGRFLPGDIRDAIKRQEMQLWGSLDGERLEACAVTEIIRYPRRTYGRIIMGMGENRERWQHFRHQIELWAEANGCRGMEAFARPGWERIFTDYRKTHVILEKDF